MDKVTYYRSEQLEIIHLKNNPITYNEHNHVSVYTIGLILYGQITLKCNKKITVYTSNNFFVIPPYQVHALLLPGAYDMISICIHKNFITEHMPVELLNMIFHMLPQTLQNVNVALLATAINALYEFKISQPLDSAILSSAYSLWCNPEKNRDLKGMADEVCYSLYHYIKKFKQQIGITPHKFQLQNRVRKAQRIIESGKLSANVALDLGFYDQSHFIKCFKSIVGLTPSEYRKSVKKL